MNKQDFCIISVIVSGLLLAIVVWRQFGPWTPARWTDTDIELLYSLSIHSLPTLASDASNAVADNADAARFGQQLFFDTRLSANNRVSCATCHQPERQFSDGLPKGRGISLSGRNTRSIVGAAYSAWQYWDGRRDSLWAQALSPLEDPAEHGGNRMQYVRFISGDPGYRISYEALFGALPNFDDTSRFPANASPATSGQEQAAWATMSLADQRLVNRVFTNLGKAIAAYERLILPGYSRFDDYVSALVDDNVVEAADALSVDEVLGLQLFIDKANCIKCHNGPLLTNNEFHNTGMLSYPGDLPDRGRIEGVHKLLEDPFNCLGEYSDDPDRHCPELTYVRTGIELVGAMRTPSLRNLGGTAPYGHKGQQASLSKVLAQYNESPDAMIGHNEAEFPLGLSQQELKWLEAFLNALDAPLATPEEWLTPPPELYSRK